LSTEWDGTWDNTIKVELDWKRRLPDGGGYTLAGGEPACTTSCWGQTAS
jgi:hypothetical protein